jgi:hypothetical protein
MSKPKPDHPWRKMIINAAPKEEREFFSYQINTISEARAKRDKSLYSRKIVFGPRGKTGQ